MKPGEESAKKPSGPGPKKTSAQAEPEVPLKQHKNILAIFDYLNDKVLGKTKDHIYPAQVSVESTSRFLTRYTSICDDPMLERYCVDTLKQYSQIDNFYIADMKGNFLMASRRPDGIDVTVIDRRGSEAIYYGRRGGRTTSRMTEKQKIAAFERGETTSGAFDPRTRPWFKRARQDKVLSWSPVYIFVTGSGDQQPGFTVSCPTLRTDGELMFVTAADFEVKNLSGFLRELKVGMTGISFIINGEYKLIAYPDHSRVVKRMGNQVVLAPAAEVLPPWARPAIDLSKDKSEQVFFYDHEGRRYIASFAPFLPSSKRNWRIVVVVPEEEFFNIHVDKAEGR
jgi:hypothetical protein